MARSATFAALATFVVTAFAARTPLTGFGFDIAFRLLGQGTHRKTHLAALVIVFEEFDIDFVADLQDILDLVGLGPCDLADMQQAFLPGQDLDEGAS